MRRLGRAVAALVLLLSLVGCGTFVGRAKKAYAQGRYLEVSEDLGRREEDLPYLSSSAQIDYGIYRGLALLNLGDALGARRWLNFANEVEKENPGTMQDEQRIVLTRALGDLAAARQPAPPSPPEAVPPASSAPLP
jgi:hypothetical protein